MLYMHVDIFLRCLPPLSLAIPSNHPVYNVNMEPIIRKQSCMICMYIYIYSYIYIYAISTNLASPSKIIIAIYLVPKQNIMLVSTVFFSKRKDPGSLKVREVMSGDPVVWEALSFGGFLWVLEVPRV